MEFLPTKIVLVGFLIGLVSLAGRRWGPWIGGLLVGLPLTAGPVVLFLAIERGAAFASDAARGTLLGLLPLTAFCLAYARLAPGASWPICTMAGWSAYLLIVAPLRGVSIGLPVAIGVVLACLSLARRLLPGGAVTGGPPNPPAWEIPLRMAAAAGMVVGLTGLAGVMGPRLGGLLAPFPVYATILAAFTHRHQGARAAIDLLRGVLSGSWSYALFFLIVSGAIVKLGLVASFGAAGAAALSVHGFLLMSRRRSHGPPRIRIVEADGRANVAAVRGLFVEYARATGVDLAFEGFEAELQALPGGYAPPAGRLLLAVAGSAPAGCVGLRSAGEATCEMKRLYVRPEFPGSGIGRMLVEAALEAARGMRYRRMRLDTLPTMREAIRLYRSFGFVEIEPFRVIPVDGAIFMERTW